MGANGIVIERENHQSLTSDEVFARQLQAKEDAKWAVYGQKYDSQSIVAFLNV